MRAYFQSEVLKMRHTFMEKIFLIAPVITIILAILLNPKFFSIDSYNWWYSMLLPGMLSLGCTLVATKDKKLNQRAVRGLPVNLKKVWLGKIVVCIGMLSGACIVLFLGNTIILGVLPINQMVDISILEGFTASIILIITFLWQIPLCLFLGSKIGLFATILINIGAYMILGILAATTRFWWAVPYAIPARLMCPVLRVLPNGLPAVKGNMTFTPELLSKEVIFPGIFITVLLFLLLTAITSMWFEKLEVK
jgi:ABC-2 type transport system permease protein